MVWSAQAVDNPSGGDRSAEQNVPADRCAHEIVRFLTISSGALAAAELHRWAASRRNAIVLTNATDSDALEPLGVLTCTQASVSL